MTDTGRSDLYCLKAEGNGYFSGTIPELKANHLYQFRLNGQELYADPASRFQPEGPFGPSKIVDPFDYSWKDQSWKGLRREDSHVFYELHIGTFTEEGTYAAAKARLADLASLGITVIELMPVHDFPGRFGWGYDGVNLFAPTRLYGTPDDFRSFIDEAHQQGIGVVLDVVYNHFGPEGNFLPKFSADYLSDRDNEWGCGIQFDHEECRCFFLTNVRYWIEEFHVDGYRLDATQAIHSSTSRPILREICLTARQAAEKPILMVAENEPQNSQIIRSPESAGYGYDALWNDDFHHAATVRLVGQREAYYSDYLGNPQEFISILKYGFLYQGQYYSWQKRSRGVPELHAAPRCYINYLQNHDQIANSSQGLRIHALTDSGNYKAMTCLNLLGPGIPLLFQGQEFAATTPFLYFADYTDNLAQSIFEGRLKFLSQFKQIKDALHIIPNPFDPSSFLRSKLDWKERENHQPIYLLHKDLIELKQSDPLFRSNERHVDGAVLSTDAFLIRYFDRDGWDRLLIVNFGIELAVLPAPEPLLAPPEGKKWHLLLSTESPRYGGQGTLPVDDILKVLGHSAIVLTTIEKEKYDHSSKSKAPLS